MSIEPIARRTPKTSVAVATSQRRLDVLAMREENAPNASPAAGRGGHPRGIYVTSSLTVDRTPEDIYRFWRNLTNLPRFMAHLESVEMRDAHPRFRARLPSGSELEWDAEITADRPNERIQWRSLPEADIESHGMVRFTPALGGRGTEVQVMLRYTPPAGAVGAAFTKEFGTQPALQVRADLERLQKLLVTGDKTQPVASAHREPKAARPGAARRKTQPQKRARKP